MIHYTAKVSEEVNRKLPARNTSVQPLTLYTDPERHNAQLYRRTDGRTDDIMMPTADHTMYQYDHLKRKKEKERKRKEMYKRLQDRYVSPIRTKIPL